MCVCVLLVSRTAVLWLDMAELVNGGAVANNVLPTCVAAATCVALLPLAELLAPCLGLGSGVEGAAKGARFQRLEFAGILQCVCHMAGHIARQLALSADAAVPCQMGVRPYRSEGATALWNRCRDRHVRHPELDDSTRDWWLY